MEATNETGKNPTGAQSRGAEGGTNLSGGLERSAIVARAIKLRAEIAEIFADAERWNRIHTPWQKAVDPDPDGELKRLADSIDRMLEKERSNVKLRGAALLRRPARTPG